MDTVVIIDLAIILTLGIGLILVLDVSSGDITRHPLLLGAIEHLRLVDEEALRHQGEVGIEAVTHTGELGILHKGRLIPLLDVILSVGKGTSEIDEEVLIDLLIVLE